MVPPLSKVVSYTPEHLETSAAHWAKAQEMWGDITRYHMSRMGSVGWEGFSGQAAFEHTHRIATLASAAQDPVVSAMATVQYQAGGLWYLKGLATDAVAAATADGFEVSEGYGIKDTLPTPPQLAQARQAQAHAHQEAIVDAVTALHQADSAVATSLKGHHQSLQMVSTGFKTDGPVDPNVIKNPHIESPTQVINAAPPVDPSKHECGPYEQWTNIAKVVGGSLAAGGGLTGSIPTGGGSAIAVIAGGKEVAEGLHDLDKCEGW